MKLSSRIDHNELHVNGLIVAWYF